MHIVIDIREALKPGKAGKGMFTAHLIDALLQTDQKMTLLYEHGQVVPPHWGRSVCCALPSGQGWHWACRKWVLAHRDSIDFYISPTSYIVPWLLGKKVKTVPIVHDLIAFRKEPHQWKATIIERMLLPRVIQNAYRICTVSNTTKDDLCATFPSLSPSSVHVIFAASVIAQASQVSESERKSIVHVGTLCPRKNQLRLIVAHKKLPISMQETYPLILAGNRGWNDDEILQEIELSPNVQWKKYVSDTEYAHLLSHCTIFAFPSLYEGFGLPILDAYNAEATVLTSDSGSMKEVAGDGAYFVDPLSVDSIAQGLLTLLDNVQLRAELCKKGLLQAKKFSWKQTAETLLNCLRS